MLQNELQQQNVYLKWVFILTGNNTIILYNFHTFDFWYVNWSFFVFFLQHKKETYFKGAFLDAQNFITNGRLKGMTNIVLHQLCQKRAQLFSERTRYHRALLHICFWRSRGWSINVLKLLTAASSSSSIQLQRHGLAKTKSGGRGIWGGKAHRDLNAYPRV